MQETEEQHGGRHLIRPQPHKAGVCIDEDIRELLGAHEGHKEGVPALRQHVPATQALPITAASGLMQDDLWHCYGDSASMEPSAVMPLPVELSKLCCHVCGLTGRLHRGVGCAPLRTVFRGPLQPQWGLCKGR